MSVSDLFDYLTTLERTGYTGALPQMNMYKGNISKSIVSEFEFIINKLKPTLSEDV